MRLSELPALPGCRLVRDGGFASVGMIDHDAELVPLFQGRFLDGLLAAPQVRCVIASEPLAGRIPERLGLLVAADPREALYDIHEHLLRHTAFYGTAATTEIASTARIHPRAFVAPHGVTLGDGVVVEPHATILPGSWIGEGAVIRAGSVVGAEGFAVRRGTEGQVPVSHAGGVRIGSAVQVLSNSTIVRAIFGGATAIGEQTVINAQSYLAHHVQVGSRCRIAAAVVIAGSARVGDDVWIGPRAVISNSVRIGDGARVSLGAVVVRDVAPGAHVSGHFALPHREFLSRFARGARDAGE